MSFVLGRQLVVSFVPIFDESRVGMVFRELMGVICPKRLLDRGLEVERRIRVGVLAAPFAGPALLAGGLIRGAAHRRAAAGIAAQRRAVSSDDPRELGKGIIALPRKRGGGDFTQLPFEIVEIERLHRGFR